MVFQIDENMLNTCERWRLDFVTADDGEIRLVVVDESTSDRIADTAGVRSGADVVRVLDAAARERGVPSDVVSDMAMEFMSEEARQWASAHRVSWTYLSRARFRRE